MSYDENRISDLIDGGLIQQKELQQIEYSEITVERITNNVFLAKCTTTKPIKTYVEMEGKTEEIARQKLELFLHDQPYKHLDNGK
ncbi:hypothetical protein [Elizabethkingia miricola]|uniref:hypothetical protein n=1 Tax=Elizabethkingia miricola TaxID=172045 RepID=UPI000B350114|nr:hypothetical protein [Elizabethkingia miricola]